MADAMHDAGEPVQSRLSRRPALLARLAGVGGGLRLRLAVLVVLALAPALGMGLFTTLQAGSHERSSARSQLRDWALLAAARENNLIDSTRGLLQVVAQTPEAHTGGEPCSTLLAGVLANHAEYSNIRVFSASGDPLCSARPFSVAADVVTMPWFQQTLRSGSFTVGVPQPIDATGGAVAPLSLPLLDGAGNVQAVIVAGLTTNWLTDFVTTIHGSAPGAAVVLFSGGVVAARSAGAGLDSGQAAPKAMQAAMAGGGGAIEQTDADGVRRLYGFAALDAQPGGPVIAVGEPTAQAYTAISSGVHRDLLLLGLAALAALILVSWLCEVFVIRGVRTLVATTRRVARGDLTARAATHIGAGEINSVARAFNTMADALQERGRQAEEARAALRSSEARFRALVQYSSDLVCVLDREGLVSYISPAIGSLLGYTAAEVMGRDPQEFIHPDDSATAQLTFEQARGGENGTIEMEVRVRHADGSWVLLDVVGSNHLDDRDVRGLVLNCRNVTERRRLEEQLARRAHYDSLTELPNRALFADRLAHALSRAGRTGSGVFVLFLDLDGFKIVNDSLGHVAGDAVLITASSRLLTCVRESDTVARLGGDEFAVLIEDAADGDAAERIAGRMIDELSRSFQLDGREVAIGGSIGVAGWTPGRPVLSADELLRRADIAMYRAKAAGKGRWLAFTDTMHDAAMLALDLQSDLSRAVDAGEFELYYQPEIELATQTVIGVEALARWRHPRLGLLAPSQFIPLAEQSGIVHGLGRWVLREACRRLRDWNAARPDDAPPLVVAVNLSARQFEQPGLVDEVAAVIAATGIEPSWLRIEITETMALDDVDRTSATLRRLKALGVRLALDDFGTGYCSLSYLQRFTVDVIKIDRSFVSALDRNAGAQAIARAVIALAGALGATVTAEGIERPEQLAFLRAAGCSHGQGYYFAPPLPDDEIGALLISGGSLGHGVGAGISA
jgi:diguanylate cyclase (GGDEF)-like protein/PAS domain S-box-containing protein